MRGQILLSLGFTTLFHSFLILALTVNPTIGSEPLSTAFNAWVMSRVFNSYVYSRSCPKITLFPNKFIAHIWEFICFSFKLTNGSSSFRQSDNHSQAEIMIVCCYWLTVGTYRKNLSDLEYLYSKEQLYMGEKLV